MDSILLVEDKSELREMLTTALRGMGYEPLAAGSFAEAKAALAKQRFCAVLSDLKLPSGTGLDVLRAAQAADPSMPVVIMTAYGTVPDAVAAMREGAFDFIQKPIDLDHLEHLLGRAVERTRLLRENIILKEEYARQYGLPRIVGEHPSMQALANELQRIAATDSTVLLLGESGSGKELVARAIHRLSSRSGQPFVALNCAAIPDALIENELFGHEKGAYTGADARSVGKFQLAHGGTIFLDEIGELPAAAQAKLLRVLEERVIERLGGTSSLPIDVRVIAATNRDLERAAGAGEFRQDLYYRIAVVPLRVPALRERGEDVVILAQHFLERFRRELKKPKLALSAGALGALRAHSWPGNVRELQNAIERVAILKDDVIEAADLGLSSNVRAAAASADGSGEANEGSGTLAEIAARAARNVERAQIEATLRECKWNKQAAAERLGISYKTLLTKLKTYELD